MLNVSLDTVHDELESSKKIIDIWLERLSRGLPVIDVPGSETQLDQLIRELCSDLRVVAGKCGNLSEILLED
jgi:hypothetical protein